MAWITTCGILPTINSFRQTYGPGAIKGKAKCKASLVRELKLSPALNKRPLLGFVGRLRQQKGIDLLVDILPQLLTKDLGVVVLGEGNAEVEEELLGMTERYPDRLFVRVGYTEDLAHRILAGADIFLMPSRYEPCGLTQMYAMRYGTVPVGHGGWRAVRHHRALPGFQRDRFHL